MRISHGHAEGQPSEVRGPTFTGAVHADPVMGGAGVPAINSVIFPAGARTHWHHHEHGQVLVVTHGLGMAAVRHGESAVLRPGDVVWFSPGEVHWHGARTDTLLAHLAISLGTTTWGDPVTDEEYTAAERNAA